MARKGADTDWAVAVEPQSEAIIQNVTSLDTKCACKGKSAGCTKSI